MTASRAPLWRTALRALPLVVVVVALVGWGGKAAYARQIAVIGMLLCGLLAAASMPARCALPRWGWSAVIVVPIAVMILAQSLPLGTWHPWLRPDAAALGAEAGAARWSLDAGATRRSLVWLGALWAFLLACLGWWRGRRSEGLADALVIVAAVHVFAAVVLAAVAPDWPSSSTRGRVRGAFVYPNHFAAFTAAVVPLALARAAAHDWRWWRSALVLLLVGGVAISASRTGLAVMAAIAVPWLWLLLPRGRRVPIAAGAAVLAVGWLALLDIGATVARFGELQHHAVTLNNRLPIWAAAWELGLAEPWGSGAGTAHLAFPRAGVELFQPARILHMHSDPFGWWVQYGWAGSVLAALALAAGYWRWRRGDRAAAPPPRRARLLAWGAGLGLAHLVVHGVFDHLLVAEAIVLVAALLVVVATAASRDAPTRSTRPWRLSLAAIVALSALLLPADWRREGHRVLARDANAVLTTPSAERGADEVATLDRLLAVTEPHHPDLAVVQARALASLPNRDRDQARARTASLRERVAAARHLAPGHAELWAAELRAALLLADVERAPIAVARLRAWAPGWELTDLLVQRALALGLASAQPAVAAALVREYLSTPGPRPDWFAPAAARVLGVAGLQDWLRAQHDLPASSWRCLEGWLARHGDLETWLRAYRRIAPARLPPTHRLLSAELGRPVGIDADAEPAQLRELSEWLHAAGLPLPAELAAALRSAGPPWVAVVPAPRWDDPLWRSQQRDWLRPHLARAWVAARLALVERVESAVQGSASLSPDDPPAAVHAVAEAAAERGDEAARAYHRALLDRHRALAYQPRGPAVRSWLWWEAPHPPPVLELAGWSYLVIDGQARGWRRGLVPLARELGDEGLHRILVLVPPRD